MESLPIFLKIRRRKCVVVGGGEVARRKAQLLLRAGAHLFVVAESIEPQLRRLGEQHGATLIQQRFTDDCLQGAVLVVAATDDETLNARVSELAQRANIPVNAVDQPSLCTFIVPAIVDRTPVVVAISSGGASPVLTRKIKELNEVMLPTRIDELANLLRRFRQRVKRGIGEFQRRVRFWEAILDGEIPELVYQGNLAAAERRLEDQLENIDTVPQRGEVYLVGAGPGDPELLTLRALRLMHKADVVLHDRLVSDEILRKIRPDADIIHVGKQRARQSIRQEDINEMMVRLASEGKRVLRLKGGDPFIFGRGGEELEVLVRAGIAFQVVPGITAASGCAAYAGIPLTHRDYAHSVRFLPGHLSAEAMQPEWEHLVQEQQTLVFYMGLLGLPMICKQLIQHGKAEDTPAALVQQGTTSSQHVLCGTLATLPGLLEQTDPEAPTLIIIGEVVRLRESLAWFNSQGTD